jgi:hypothetical protein
MVRTSACDELSRAGEARAVWSIWSLWFIWLVSFNRKPDKSDKLKNGLLISTDCFSILLGWEERAPTEDSIGTAEILAGL